MQQEGIGQDLYACAAQVRRGKTDIVGTAFVISEVQPLLLTCHHVVQAALPGGHVELNAEIYVYFPQISGNDPEKKLFLSHVHKMIEGYEDDIVLLKLAQEGLPSEVKAAILGDATQSVKRNIKHDFSSFGFQKIGNRVGVPAYGKIIGLTSPTLEEEYHLLTLETQGVDHGMSGAPVLDMSRNLVVGVVSETSVQKLKNTDISFAVQSEVAYNKWDIKLHPDYQLAMTQPDPPSELAQNIAKQFASNIDFPLKSSYQPTQPPELPEWAGRIEMLKGISSDYENPRIHLTGLIGFGGEGKSSIAYRWVTHYLLKNSDLPQPDGVFWWSFYENRSFESMIERLTAYLYGEDQLQEIRGTAQRVNFIGALAITRKIVLILDGFEVMQEGSGDKYGNIINYELKRLLDLFTQPGSPSFCLVTSRAPLLDFLSHTAHVQRDLTRLSVEDGRQLLWNLNLSGEDGTLDKIVSDWDGHALTISLVGTYLRERNIVADKYNIDLFPEIEAYENELPRYRQVRRILRRYDNELSDADKAFLKIFSMFRLPVDKSAFKYLFRRKFRHKKTLLRQLFGSSKQHVSINKSLIHITDKEFTNLLRRLIKFRLLRVTYNPNEKYNIHPLVQHYYSTLLELTHSNDEIQLGHKSIADYYEKIVVKIPENPTLNDLKLYMEVIYHLCKSKLYDNAFYVYWENLNRGEDYFLLQKIEAYNTVVEMWSSFFMNGDLDTDPLLSNQLFQRAALASVGYSIQQLGKLKQAISLHNRKNKIALEMNDHINASVGFRNLTDIYRDLGELDKALETVNFALTEAQQIRLTRFYRLRFEAISRANLAWIYHLMGHIETASLEFKNATQLQIEMESNTGYLYSSKGIQYADHLQRTYNAEDKELARLITLENIEKCRRNNQSQESQCYRILGDLEIYNQNHESVLNYYEQAIGIAFEVETVSVEIEALLARGRWYAKYMNDAERAFADLDQALSLALRGEYRLYEADIRVALAWAHKAAGKTDAAHREANEAKRMSQNMGYHWGQVDADELLDSL